MNTEPRRFRTWKRLAMAERISSAQFCATKPPTCPPAPFHKRRIGRLLSKGAELGHEAEMTRLERAHAYVWCVWRVYGRVTDDRRKFLVSRESVHLEAYTTRRESPHRDGVATAYEVNGVIRAENLVSAKGIRDQIGNRKCKPKRGAREGRREGSGRDTCVSTSSSRDELERAAALAPSHGPPWQERECCASFLNCCQLETSNDDRQLK